VTEGISDIVYLHCALRSLVAAFPALATEKDGKIVRSVSFLKPSGTTRDILNLGHGTSGQASLVLQYSNYFRKYRHKPMAHPVIILCDNDDGAKKVFGNAKSKNGKTVSTVTTDPFYHLGENLYLIKTPEGVPPLEREIEALFDPEVLGTKVDGKPFDPKKDHGDDKAYGKVIFAERVVRPNAETIDFSGFSELLSRIVQSVTHYKAIKSAVRGVSVASSTVTSP
jgi:RNA-directed DNA polymerase